MKWFHSNKSLSQNTGESQHLLRIFALSGPSTNEFIPIGEEPPVSLAGFMLMKGDKVATCLIPTLSREGHVSCVFAGTLDDFNKMKEDVSARFTKRLTEIRSTELSLNNFLVVGFTFAFPEDPLRNYLVYETLVSPTPIQELADIYNRLKSVTCSEVAQEVEAYFTDSVRKKWLNGVIEGLENMLNWPDFVAKSIELSKKG